MANEIRSFYPLYYRSSETAVQGGPSTTVAGTLAPSVTAVAAITAAPSPQFPGTDKNTYVQIQIANKTSVWVHVNFGVFGAVVAATLAAGYPVGPGTVVVVSVDPEVSGASVISDGAPAASTSVVFTRGEGI